MPSFPPNAPRSAGRPIAPRSAGRHDPIDALAPAALAAVADLRDAVSLFLDPEAPADAADGGALAPWPPRAVVTHVLGVCGELVPAACALLAQGGREVAFDPGDPYEREELRSLTVGELLERLSEACERAAVAVRTLAPAVLSETVSTPVGEYPARRFLEVALVDHTLNHAAELRGRLAGDDDEDARRPSEEVPELAAEGAA